MAVDYLKLLKSLSSEYLGIHENRCVVVRNRNAKCRRCAKVCTSGAIRVDAASNDVAIDPELCVGCGTCASVCPTGALEAKNPNDIRLVNSCLSAAEICADGTLAIACESAIANFKDSVDQERVASVVCLGRVEESLFANLAVRGVQRIHLVRDDCEQCELARGVYTANQAAESFNSLMRAWGCGARAKLCHRFPQTTLKSGASSYDPSKRAMFTWAKDSAAQAVIGEVEGAIGVSEEQAGEPRFLKVGDDGTLPQAVPSRREFLLDALACLDLPADGPIASRLWGHVEIDAQSCISCGTCVMFCPTGSLRSFDTGSDDEYGIGISRATA